MKIITILIALVLVAPGMTLAQEFDLEAAKVVFETKCSRCHALSRPLGKTKDEAGWRKTVMRMQSKTPSWISDEEAEQVIGYLSSTRGAQ